MNFRMNLLRLVMLLLASWGGLMSTLAQPGDLGDLCELPGRGKVKAVLSFRATRVLSSQTAVRLFLAVWYERENGVPVGSPQGQVVVYEKDGLRFKETFNFEDKKQMGFHEFASLNSLTVPGLVLTFSSEIGWGGPTLVVALVQEKFEIVYQGGSSELVDLDGNGTPEIFESVWPDGDGYPSRTIIHVWDGLKYRKLTTSKWEYRFSRSVLNRLRSYSKNRKVAVAHTVRTNRQKFAQKRNRPRLVPGKELIYWRQFGVRLNSNPHLTISSQQIRRTLKVIAD